MPPKYPPIPPQPSNRRPDEDYSEPNDAHDVLCVMDIVDVLDAMPVDLTKCLADLRELDAVLNATITHLTSRLESLTDVLSKSDATPCDRFQLLLEIAEELTRFKLGGEDKIRVAGAACDMLVTHQQHVQTLISGSTLLLAPPSSKPLHVLPIASTSKRHRNSPMPARNGDTGETPTKKKKVNRQGMSVVTAPAVEDWEEESIPPARSPVPAKKAAAGAGKKSQKVKATAASRLSPADSLDQPTGWRATLAAANREETPASRLKDDNKANRQSPALTMPSSTGGADDGPSRPIKAPRNASKKSKAAGAESSKQAVSSVPQATYATDMGVEVDENGMEIEADHQLYCYCQKASYGEMIACDADDCPIEWFHLSCTELDAAPKGDWLCPDCSERFAKNAGKKKKPQGKRRR